MAAKNPLAKITGAAQGVATLPLKVTEKVADRAVGVVAGGVRVASNLVYATADRAKSMVGSEEKKDVPRPAAAPPAAPTESVEAMAEAAVAREMAEEPVTKPTPSKAARATARPTAPKPEGVDDEPLIDPATAKAVKSETDILRAAADVDKNL